MSDEHGADTSVATIYEGRPKLPMARGELKRWGRFVRWLQHIAPFLRGEGEDYLKALVEQERAKARLMNAQAEKALAEAEYLAIQTAEKAAQLDERKAARITAVLDAAITDIPTDDPELLGQIEDLRNKLSFLHAKYSLEIRLLESPSKLETGDW